MTKDSGAVLGLGAGFYDHSKLLDATEAAVTAAPAPDAPAVSKQDAVDAAVADVDTSDHRSTDPRAIDGYAFHTRHKHGLTEKIQVPTHKIDDADEATARAETPSTKGSTTKAGGAGTSKE